MRGWEVKRLDEIAAFRGGGTPSKEVARYWQGDIPWVSPKDMKSLEVSSSIDTISPEAIEHSATSWIPKGSVLVVTRSGILARTVPVGLTTRELTVNQDIKAICPGKALDSRFLLYFMLASERMILGLVSRGATVHRIETGHLRQLQIPLPPLDEQRRIVAILDEAFAGLAVMRRNAEANLANARALFDSHLNAVFSQRGEGWVETTLRDVCDQITDGTHQTPTYFDDGYIFLSSKSVTSGAINWNNSRFIDKIQHLTMQKRVSPKFNDILLAKNGTTGVAALVDRDVEFDIYVSLALLRPKVSMSPKFMLYFINSPAAKEQFNKRLKGVGVPNLHLKEIREVTIAFPHSRDLQDQIAMHLEEIRNETTRLEALYRQKLAAIDELKQSILHRAFSGQLSREAIAA